MTRGKTPAAPRNKKPQRKNVASLFAKAESNIDNVHKQLKQRPRSRTKERLLAIEQSMLNDTDSDTSDHTKRVPKTKNIKQTKTRNSKGPKKHAPKPQKVRQSESEKFRIIQS